MWILARVSGAVVEFLPETLWVVGIDGGTTDAIAQETANRNSVFAVCFCFLFSIAPHFRNLPLWVTGIVVFALAWRGLQNLNRAPAVPRTG